MPDQRPSGSPLGIARAGKRDPRAVRGPDRGTVSSQILGQLSRGTVRPRDADLGTAGEGDPYAVGRPHGTETDWSCVSLVGSEPSAFMT